MINEQSQSRRADAFSCPDKAGGRHAQGPRLREEGFTLIEVLISTLVLTIGMIAIAGLLAVTVQAQITARESARSVRLAQDKMDELMKAAFTSPAVSVGGGLNANVANYNESPDAGTTIRWVVANGPTADTRVVTVRVISVRSQGARQTNLSSIIREW